MGKSKKKSPISDQEELLLVPEEDWVPGFKREGSTLNLRTCIKFGGQKKQKKRDASIEAK